MKLCALTIVLCSIFTGCAHHQLRFNATRQAQTVADVHTKQVLDNVAKFVADAHALPHFSYPNQGATNVTDSGSGNVGMEMNPYKWNWGLNASRSIGEAYTMTPINDPDKLTLMRCAYQRAVGVCTCKGESGHCPNCEKNFNRFYLGDEDVSKTGETTDDGKSVFRVKGSVSLVYFNEGSERYTEIEPIGNGPVHHFVAAGRDGSNKVIYEYLRTDGAARNLPYVGQSMFKLYQAEIRSLEEFTELRHNAKNTEGVLTFYLGKGYKKQFDLLQPIDSSRVYSGQKTGVLSNQDSDADDPFNAELLVPYKSSLYYNIPAKIKEEGSEEEKSKYRVKVSYPKALDATADIGRVYIDRTVDELTRRSGRVTTECLYENCWFKVGTRRDVPKDCCTTYVGHYCGTYVWVPPCGRNQLTKLTLTILDIASSDAASNPTTEVYAFIGEDGKTATTYDKAAYLAKATVGRGQSVAGVLPSSPSNADPPNENEIRVLQRSRDELRLKFKRALSRGKVDVYATLSKVKEDNDGAFPSTVEFVSQDYLLKSLELQNGDTLVALAGGILSKNSLPSSDGEGGNANSDEIISAARDFLNAEERLQDISGKAPGPQRDGAVPPNRRGVRPSGVGANVLRSLQDLDTLGAMR